MPDGARCRRGHHGRARRAASDPTARAADTNRTGKPADCQGAQCCGRPYSSSVCPSSHQVPDGARCRRGHHGRARRAAIGPTARATNTHCTGVPVHRGGVRRREQPSTASPTRPSSRMGPDGAGSGRRHHVRPRRAASGPTEHAGDTIFIGALVEPPRAPRCGRPSTLSSGSRRVGRGPTERAVALVTTAGMHSCGMLGWACFQDLVNDARGAMSTGILSPLECVSIRVRWRWQGCLRFGVRRGRRARGA